MQLLRVCVYIYIYIYMGENGQMLLLKKKSSILPNFQN